MKKLTSLVLSIVMAAFTFTSCASSNGGNERTSTTTVATTKPAVTTQEVTTTTTTVVTTTPATTTTAPATTTEATTTEEQTTTPVSISPDDNKVLLNVQNIVQFPELPLGGTIVASVMALNYYGFDITKTDFLQYLTFMKLDDNGLWEDPNKVFIGDPEGYNLAYGSSTVLKNGIKAYWKKNNITGYKVVDLGGSDFSDLFSELDNANPVIIWVGGSMMDIDGTFTSLPLKNGGTFEYTPCAHSVCLIGYDNENDTVFVCDSMYNDEYVEYPKSDVEKVYDQMGKQALVIHKK